MKDDLTGIVIGFTYFVTFLIGIGVGFLVWALVAFMIRHLT